VKSTLPLSEKGVVFLLAVSGMAALGANEVVTGFVPAVA